MNIPPCPFKRRGDFLTLAASGRKSMIWQEEDWIDEDAMSHWDKGE
jgi:hypothetical protein